MSEGKDLPKGWEYVSMGELFLIERGGSPRPIEDFITDKPDGINWIKIGDTKGITKYIFKTREKIKPSGLYKSRKVFIDDFILSNSMSFGHPYIMKTEGCIHDGWLVIRTPKTLINTDFLYHILSSQFVYQQFSNLAKGSTVKNLNIEAVQQVFIYLPPLAEQHRIVAKIEELFSSLDKGIESLKTAQAQLKVYRQAVLKWAFEGKLTNKNVKEGELPNEWEEKSIKDITTVLGDGLHGTPKYTEDGDYFFINGNNLTDGKIEIKENTKRVSFTEFEKYKKPLTDKTIFVSINGTLGNTAFYNNEKVILGKSACYFNVKEEIDKRYIRYCLTSHRFFNYANKEATGSTIKNVGLKTMREFEVPIPPNISEQNRIVDEIESRLSVCDKIEESISTSLLQAEALRQSILKKAFEGKLVAQDPNDEPASVLLERIKAEKAKNKPAKKVKEKKVIPQKREKKDILVNG